MKSESKHYAERLSRLRARKQRDTLEKNRLLGSMDHDDWAIILPPPDRRRKVRVVNSSGQLTDDFLLTGFDLLQNHPGGGFFGPEANGENFKRLLDAHPVFIDPNSTLAGAYMANFRSYRDPYWHPDYPYAEAIPEIKTYHLHSGIGGNQHFCQDMKIGYELGWGGILEKIRRFRQQHGPEKQGFYDGLTRVVQGIQGWIERHARAAEAAALTESDPVLRANLQEMARINYRLVCSPPQTFHEACQWTAWYLMAARMYNGSGSLGRVDELLFPFYQRDLVAGLIDDEDAIFHLICLFLADTAYFQVGGLDTNGQDVTNPLSFLVLEAIHRLKIPANGYVIVGKGIDERLFQRGVEILLEDKTGFPKFVNGDRVYADFTKNGYPVELARQRTYAGCHWATIPGQEYALNDLIKINLAMVFDVALHDMMSDGSGSPSTALLWQYFETHLRRAVAGVAKSIDFHMAHHHKVMPELVLDLLCYGPIEKGLDASQGGLAYYNFGVDGAGLATTADSFAAIEQRVERERLFSWEQLLEYLDSDWAGAEGERARVLMSKVPRYGSGRSLADEYAIRVSKLFTQVVKEKKTPGGYTMIPGLFSWAYALSMGAVLGATPDGRHRGAPISHGANPAPGFRKDGAPTALAVALASVQPGYGNAAPMQVEIDPSIFKGGDGQEIIRSLIRGHFQLGGTQVSINVLDSEKVLAAHQNPDLYPDLIVRATGFSVYFYTLSKEFRQMVVDRIMSAA